MQDFIEKWNKDPRYKTKIKLLLYTLFIVFVGIFAVSNQKNIQNNELENQLPNENETSNKIENEVNDNNQLNEIIKLPNEYNYKINITINEKMYTYIGSKNAIREKITKTIDDINTNYIYENGSYYKENDAENYILTTKEEVYDIIDYNYLDINTINQYLSKATKIENEYIVYLKDIILGNNSQDYITITVENNKINLDYTKLFKKFDKTINQYLIDIEIE